MRNNASTQDPTREKNAKTIEATGVTTVPTQIDTHFNMSGNSSTSLDGKAGSRSNDTQRGQETTMSLTLPEETSEKCEFCNRTLSLSGNEKLKEENKFPGEIVKMSIIKIDNVPEGFYKNTTFSNRAEISTGTEDKSKKN